MLYKWPVSLTTWRPHLSDIVKAWSDLSTKRLGYGTFTPLQTVFNIFIPETFQTKQFSWPGLKKLNKNQQWFLVRTELKIFLGEEQIRLNIYCKEEDADWLKRCKGQEVFLLITDCTVTY